MSQVLSLELINASLESLCDEVSQKENPKIKVATRVNDQKSQNEFERAGADIIVAPEITGGYELADRIIGVK